MNSTVPSPATIESLRRELKDKFADAHRDCCTPLEMVPSGIDWLDRAVSSGGGDGSDDGGVPRGALCEISGQSMAAGALVVAQMLQHTLRERQRLVLIDGADSFDPACLPIFGEAALPGPQGEPPDYCDVDGAFLWARCRRVEEAVQVADMILRDGNLPRTIVDLQHNAAREIRAIPRSSWLRLRSLVEDSGASCVLLTPEPLIACAARRHQLRGPRVELAAIDSPEPFAMP